jgi:hypothetical protein
MIFILCIHAIGVPEGVMLLEFEGASQEEEPENQATEAAAAEELPECPDHYPSSFLKGKPRSIISLPILLMSLKVIRIAALHDRSCLETLAAYYLP